ncbi:MAG: hypothetical protein HUK22_00555, partial [Thermoguttaceae bacterium]|nr:hypothetical protein [Thermoguttaceae bacterium]
MTHAKMILLGAILCVAPCFSRPIFAQVPLYDSATAETVRETRFPSLSSPSAPATAQIGASVPTKYVLARQGALWVGVLRDRGDAIAVEMENGGSTVISKLDVAFIGDSRDEVFEFKRAQTSLTDVDEILKLADWANRRGLAVRGVEFLESVEIPGASVAERRAVERKIAELRESERIRAEIAQKNEERKRAEA